MFSPSVAVLFEILLAFKLSLIISALPITYLNMETSSTWHLFLTWDKHIQLDILMVIWGDRECNVCCATMRT